MIGAGLLVIRLAVGLAIAAHGAQKLFGWWGGGGIGGTAKMFESVGFAPGRLAAFLGGLGEAGGGLLLALGLLTPLGCFAVIAMMLGAIVSVTSSKGWWNTRGGSEFPAIVAALAFGLALSGPGRFSADATIGWRLWGSEWALAVAVASLAVMIVMVALVRAHRVGPQQDRRAEIGAPASERAGSARP